MQRSRSLSPRSQNSDRYSNNSTHKRFKYCCRKCKHTQDYKKSCICVVPMNQRRTEIGSRGCKTCGCHGCSVEDFISRGEDPVFQPKRREFENYSQGPEEKFDPRNGCCRKCMKAFSKTGKSCLCQVPKEVRKTRLAVEGCKICGCTGCNPRDDSVSGSIRSASPDQSVYSRGPSVDEREHNLNNIDNSMIGKVVVVEYGMYPALIGLGIPQRTPNYILGRPL